MKELINTLLEPKNVADTEFYQDGKEWQGFDVGLIPKEQRYRKSSLISVGHNIQFVGMVRKTERYGEEKEKEMRFERCLKEFCEVIRFYYDSPKTQDKYNYEQIKQILDDVWNKFYQR